MISSYMNYGALSAKVRAMYGKRLRHADFEHMSTLTDPRDVFEFLRAQPGWWLALAPLGVGTDYVGRVELEEALRRQLRHEYEGLSHFLPKDDKALVAFPLRLNELEQIAAALRARSDFAGILASAKGGIYYEALLCLRPEEGGAPDYATAEALLHSAYYAYMYKVIHQHYAGQTKKILLQSFGAQVDLLNLIHILRMKVYFPGSDAYHAALFPFHYKLKEDKVKAMCEAADPESVFALLQDTPYAKDLEDLPLTVAGIEDYYRRMFYAFNKRQLTAGEPSVYTAMAYLNLKELEFQALINVIESVKYGVRYDDTFARMVGD